MRIIDYSFELLEVIVIFAVTAGVLFAWFFIRALIRLKHNANQLRHIMRLSEVHCPQCDYDLGGRLSEQCPECGHRFTEKQYRRLSSIWEFLRKGGGT